MTIEQGLIEAIRAAKSITVITGAGVSAESGIPTFRDVQTGLWAKYRPEDLATPEAFEHDPKLVWDWYASRRQQLAQVRPNPGHEALAKLEAHCGTFTLITQNVDRLHQQAGSGNVIELHGNIHGSICHRTRRLIDPKLIEASEQQPPRSPHHPDGLARPAVVWFGESLPEGAFDQAIAATRCDVFFSIGTSSVVQPAASLALMAAESGAFVVEINPTETPLTPHADAVIRRPAGETLPTLLKQAFPNQGPNLIGC